MDEKPCYTLVQSAEDITPSELCLAPELTTLIALDASLLATINILEFQNPFLLNSDTNSCNIPKVAEDHIVNSICILAKALRKNLATFYSLIQMDLERTTEGSHEIKF